MAGSYWNVGCHYRVPIQTEPAWYQAAIRRPDVQPTSNAQRYERDRADRISTSVGPATGRPVYQSGTPNAGRPESIISANSRHSGADAKPCKKASDGDSRDSYNSFGASSIHRKIPPHPLRIYSKSRSPAAAIPHAAGYVISRFRVCTDQQVPSDAQTKIHRPFITLEDRSCSTVERCCKEWQPAPAPHSARRLLPNDSWHRPPATRLQSVSSSSCRIRASIRRPVFRKG